MGVEVKICCWSSPPTSRLTIWSRAIFQTFQSFDPHFGGELNRELTVSPPSGSVWSQHRTKGVVLGLAKATDGTGLGPELHQRVVRRRVSRPALAAARRHAGLGECDPAGMHRRLHRGVFRRQRETEARG